LHFCLKLITSLHVSETDSITEFFRNTGFTDDRSIGNSRSIPPLGAQSQFTWAGSTTFISPSSAPSACYSFPFFSLRLLPLSIYFHAWIPFLRRLARTAGGERAPRWRRRAPQGSGGALPRSGSDVLPPLLSAAASMSTAAATGRLLGR